MIPVTAAAVMWRKRQKETEMGRIYMDLYGVRLMIVNLGALVLFVPVWILVTQMILRIPLLGYLKTNWEWFMILPYSHYFIYMAIAAFSAGVFEETGRIVGFGVFVMAVGGLMGCRSLGGGGNEQGEILKELPEGFDKETVREQAMEDIEIAQSKDYESWKSRFAEDLQSSLTEESYDSYLKILEKQGEFKEFGKCTYLGQIKDNKEYGGVIIVVKYEEGNVNYSLAYDEDMNLVSFTM